MNISKTEIKAMAKTLPIGFYTKRPIPVTLDDDSDTSYYSPVTDEICISTQQIAQAMTKFPETADREVAIRSNLYHEVSHAILTPVQLTINDPVNIFEDERIETLLANYYLDVDFNSDKYYMNGLEVGEVPPAYSPINAFYNLVRFHSGKKSLLQEVDRMIEEFATLNRRSGYCSSISYYTKIMNLYEKVKADFNNPTNEQQPSLNNGDIRNQSGNGQQATPSENGTTSDKDMQGKPGHGLSADFVKQCVEESFAIIAKPQINTEIYDSITRILTNFRKKNSGGSAMRTYSGTLNPRSIVHNDYKIFDRPATVRCGNSYGALHLNLFIDKSGSFWSSETIVNELLCTLTQIEQKFTNFSLDVVFCGYGQKKAETPKERILSCSGGNNLTNEIFPLFKSLQLPQVYNYNVVLFDGDAFSSRRPRTDCKEFKAFDTNNTIIITDKENHRYIDGTVKNCKVVYTKKYTEELIKNVRQALEKAFR